MPTVKRPADCYPDLTEERLSIIAKALADVRYTTLQELSGPLDDEYTRECAIYGRQRNMLIDLCHSGQYDWLTLAHAGMDVRFRIGKVTCRFFTDDAHSPAKDGFFKRNATDTLFDTDDEVPVFMRFVVEKAVLETDEDRVHFVGYNAYQEKVCEWTYAGRPVGLYAVDDIVPPAVQLPPATVELHEVDIERTGKAVNDD